GGQHIVAGIQRGREIESFVTPVRQIAASGALAHPLAIDVKNEAIVSAHMDDELVGFRGERNGLAEVEYSWFLGRRRRVRDPFRGPLFPLRRFLSTGNKSSRQRNYGHEEKGNDPFRGGGARRLPPRARSDFHGHRLAPDPSFATGIISLLAKTILANESDQSYTALQSFLPGVPMNRLLGLFAVVSSSCLLLSNTFVAQQGPPPGIPNAQQLRDQYQKCP